MDAQAKLTTEDYCENETFTGLDLPGAALARKEFFRCTFQGARLQESQWERAQFEDCVFEDCDLSGMKLALATASGVQFKGCKLMGVHWGDLAPHPRLSFADCHLRYSSFSGMKLSGTAFLRCRAGEVSFLDVDLARADFTGTDLTDATFRSCDLSQADFSQARGVFLDPAANKVRGASIPLDAAVRLAHSLGMRVSGFDAEPPEPAPRRGGAKKK
jgi:uncharacterized protein YjbI with pentapeptide repeats